MKRHSIVLTLVLLFCLVLSGCDGAKSLSPTDTAVPPTDTATPKPSATATLPPTNTPLPTDTPTPTLRPTWTPPPPASPTPKGYYNSSDFGFSLSLPSGWSITEEGENVQFGNILQGIYGTAVSFVSGQTPAEDTFDQILGSFFEGTTPEYIDQGETTIDGVPAKYAIVDYSPNPDQTLRFILYYLYKEPREYFYYFYGPDTAVIENEATFQTLVDSIRFTSAATLGFDRDTAIVMQGGIDPTEDDVDPARTHGGSAGYVGLLYSGLVILSADLEIVNDLAESYTVSPDGLVYTFKIRPDAYFQSGKPITAQDFKYSLERAADPKTDSTVAETYLGDIKGFSEKLQGKAKEVEGVSVIDDLTLEITLEQPVPYFLSKLTYPTSFVVDQERVEESSDNWLNNPNASGPFMLSKYVKNEAMVFEPNPGNPNRGKAEALVYRLYLPGKSIDYYQGDEIDIAYLGDPADIKAVESPDHPLNSELSTNVSLCTSMIQINNTLPPMDDPNVRKAFALAIDREKLLDQFSEGTDIYANTVLPPSMPGYTTGLFADEFDPQAAKDALAASKYADDMPEVIYYESGYAGSDDPFTDAIINMWKEVLGVDVTVEYLDPEDSTHAAREGNGHLVSYGWCADYVDPQNFLDVLYHTDSEFNVARYSNPDIDQLLVQARTELDPVVRLDLYEQSETMLLADHALIPLSHNIYYALVKPYVKDFVVPSIGSRNMDIVYIER
jgi:oligopeptide transport system substrate-binding protein